MSSKPSANPSKARRAGAVQRWFLRAQIGLYRRTGGRLAGRIGRTPVLLLTTIGRKSGQPHTVPLGYFELDGTRFVVASNGGAERDPAWYLNLMSHSEVRVEVGSDEYQAIATPATGEERARLWDHLMAVAPAYRRYAHSRREIPVVVLRRVPASEAGT